MTIEAEEVVEEYLNDTVEGFLSTLITPQDYLEDEMDEEISIMFEDLEEECTHGDEFDWDEYIDALKQVAVKLNRQRHVLALGYDVVYGQTHQQPSDKVVSPFRGDWARKMMYYAITGIDLSSTDYSKRFHNPSDYQFALQLWECLPPELQPKAAEMLQMYAARTFDTEF